MRFAITQDVYTVDVKSTKLVRTLEVSGKSTGSWKYFNVDWTIGSPHFSMARSTNYTSFQTITYGDMDGEIEGTEGWGMG